MSKQEKQELIGKIKEKGQGTNSLPNPNKKLFELKQAFSLK